jgi:hypothetical protein
MRSAFARCSASLRQKSAVSFVFLFAIFSEEFEDMVELHVNVLAGGQDSLEHLAIRQLRHMASVTVTPSLRKVTI